MAREGGYVIKGNRDKVARWRWENQAAAGSVSQGAHDSSTWGAGKMEATQIPFGFGQGRSLMTPGSDSLWSEEMET